MTTEQANAPTIQAHAQKKAPKKNTVHTVIDGQEVEIEVPPLGDGAPEIFNKALCLNKTDLKEERKKDPVFKENSKELGRRLNYISSLGESWVDKAAKVAVIAGAIAGAAAATKLGVDAYQDWKANRGL